MKRKSILSIIMTAVFLVTNVLSPDTFGAWMLKASAKSEDHKRIGAVYYTIYDNYAETTYCYQGDGGAPEILVLPAQVAEKPLTRIAGSSFSNRQTIKEVEIPSSVKYIDSNAFADCTDLHRVQLSQNLKGIGSYAFQGCSSLHVLDIPASVEAISQGAFSGCTSLSAINYYGSLSRWFEITNDDCGLETGTIVNCIDGDQSLTVITDATVTTAEPLEQTKPNISTDRSRETMQTIRITTTVSSGPSLVEDGVYSGACGENVTWEFDSNTGIFTVSGTGAMDDYEKPSDTPWYRCIIEIYWEEVQLGLDRTNYLQTLIIEDGVTHIGDNAFSKIPFRGKPLNSTETQPVVTEVFVKPDPAETETSASDSAETETGTPEPAETATEPQSLIDILDDLFGTEHPQAEPVRYEPVSVQIADSVTSIGESAFAGATGITELTLPANLQTLGDSAFSKCTDLTGITLPDSLAVIGSSVFADCQKLGKVSIPEGITSIPDHTFSGCWNLTDIDLPDSVVSIGDEAFCGCTRLHTLPMPESLVSVGKNVLKNTMIISVTLPKSLTRIEDGMFAQCGYLKEVVIPSNIAVIGDEAFMGCSALETINLPDTVIKIERSAFSGCPLKSVRIPKNAEYIGEAAFSGCKSLSDISFSADLCCIGKGAFSGCTALVSVTLPKNLRVVGRQAFMNCTNLESIEIPPGLTEIRDGAFTGCSKLQELDLSHSDLLRLGAESLSQCQELHSVTLPEQLVFIGSQAFYDCRSLTNITVPNSVDRIGKSAFNSCSQLSEIKLPCYLEKIESFLFSGCSKLPGIAIPGTVTEIGDGAFSGCASLEKLSLPSGLQSIGKSAFSSCASLTGIDIPNDITVIREGTFAGCSKLAAISIPASVDTIEKSAFGSVYSDTDSCNSLSDVFFGGSKSQWNQIEIQGSNAPLTNAEIHFAAADEGEQDSFKMNDHGECGDNLHWSCNISQLHIYGSGKMNDYQPEEAPWYKYRYRFREIIIAEGCTKIGSYAFFGCTSAYSIHIPKSVTDIGESAFNVFENGNEESVEDLPTVHYPGTWDEWKNIKIGAENYLLTFERFRFVIDTSGVFLLDHTGEAPYSDIIEKEALPDFFTRQDLNAWDYHPELVYTMSILADGAYDYYRTRSNLRELGFNVQLTNTQNVYFNETYPLDWREAEKYPDNVGFCFARKKVANDKQIIMIIIRGTFGELSTLLNNSEWKSNLNCLQQLLAGYGEHTGFSSAENKVLAELKNWLQGEIPTEKTTYFVTGHSRGAGVANLLEKDLMDAGVSGGDLYAYNFACPDVEKTFETDFNYGGMYDNIYNVGVAGDLVTLIPGQLGNIISNKLRRNALMLEDNISLASLKVWGKYGQSRWFCDSWRKNAYIIPSKHGGENYITFMKNRWSWSGNQSKSWLDYRELALIDRILDVEEMKVEAIKTIGSSLYDFSQYVVSNQLYEDCFAPPMNAIADGFQKAQQILTGGIHCPVDVEITDADGTVIAAVCNGEVICDNTSDVKALVWTEGDEKFFTVFGNSDLHINLTGTDSGSMDAEIMMSSGSPMETESAAFYNNIPLEPGKKMTLEINSSSNQNGNQITVKNTAGDSDETIAPTFMADTMIYGDVNLDNDLTISDAVLISRVLAEDESLNLSTDSFMLSDVTRDGIISVLDIRVLLRLLAVKI